MVLASRGWRPCLPHDAKSKEKRPARSGAVHCRRARQSLKVIEELPDVTTQASIQAAKDRSWLRLDNQLDAVVHNAGVAAAGDFGRYTGIRASTGDGRRLFRCVCADARPPSRPSAHKGAGAWSSCRVKLHSYGQPTNAIYCASKWAIEGWEAEATAYELEPFGMDVVLVEPGPYRSPRDLGKHPPKFRPRRAVPIGAGCSRCCAVLPRCTCGAPMSRDPREVALVIVRALEAPPAAIPVLPVGPFARLNHFFRGQGPGHMAAKGDEALLGHIKCPEAS